jgi:hypothetical protein
MSFVAHRVTKDMDPPRRRNPLSFVTQRVPKDRGLPSAASLYRAPASDGREPLT